MQAAKDSIKTKRADRMVRVLPLQQSIDVCNDLLGHRMLPKWLQEFQRKAPLNGVGSVDSCDVLQSPEYWVFNKYVGVGHFWLQYK